MTQKEHHMPTGKSFRTIIFNNIAALAMTLLLLYVLKELFNVNASAMETLLTYWLILTRYDKADAQ